MSTLALLLALATAPIAPELLPPTALSDALPVADPLSAYAAQGDYILACAAYLESGDVTFLAVDIGEGEIGTLECEDYPEAMPIVAARAREKAFRAWYAKASKRLGLSANPDDPRHGYDYRKFFDAMRAGKFPEPKRRGDYFPGIFEVRPAK
jgi:hypothetical protein